MSYYTYRSGAGSRVALPLSITVPTEPMRQADFAMLVTRPSRQERAQNSLIYDMQSGARHQDRSIERYKAADGSTYAGGGGEVTYDLTNPFTLCVIGDTVALYKMCKADPALLSKVDEMEATLLYKAARSGFRDMVEMLLVLGCPVDSQIYMGSTALHAAAFYGHDLIVALLLARNADRDLKNKYGNTPLDEARNDHIKELLRSTTLQTKLQSLVDAKVAVNIRPVMIDERIVAWKASRTPDLVQSDLIADSRPPADWLVAWHGTKPQFLESILRHNLQAAGSKAGGKEVDIVDGHIPLGETVFGIENFAAAVFVSPCVAYAAHPAYAGRIGTAAGEWITLVEVRVRPNSFKAFRSTVGGGYVPLADSVEPEYRVATELPGHVGGETLEGHGKIDLVHDFLRLEHGGGMTNCVVTGIVFLAKDFLDDCEMTNPELSEVLSR